MRQVNMANPEEPHVYRLPDFLPRDQRLRAQRISITNALNYDAVGFWSSLDRILDHPSHLKAYPRTILVGREVIGAEEWPIVCRLKAWYALKDDCRKIYVKQQQTPKLPTPVVSMNHSETTTRIVETIFDPYHKAGRFMQGLDVKAGEFWDLCLKVAVEKAGGVPVGDLQNVINIIDRLTTKVEELIRSQDNMRWVEDPDPKNSRWEALGVQVGTSARVLRRR